MNTLKNSNADDRGIAMDIDGGHRRDVERNNIRYNALQVVLGFLIIAISAIYIPASAANEEGRSQVASKPDNLAEYAVQQINTIKDENISVSGITEEIFDPTERSAVQQAGTLQGDVGLTGEYSENYYLLNKLNVGLPPLAEPPNLATPLATLGFFQSAVMKQQYDLAAYALNMNLIDEKNQRTRSLDLAKQLDFLLSEKELYVFDDMPDRPDGLIEPPLGNDSSVMGIPRRSIQLGYIEYRERRVPVYLERVRVGDQAPVWMFSAQTVGNIENLYKQYHPSEFERYLPTWLKFQFFGIALWEFSALIMFFLFTMGVGWILSKSTEKLISRYVDNEKYNISAGSANGVADLANKLTVPLTFTISFSLVFTLVSGGFPYLDAVASSTRPLIWTGLVFSAMWLGIRTINFFANRYQDTQIENLGEEHFDKVRRRRTYVSIFRRVFIFVMILGSIWIGLSEFANMEGLGKTLLTSAGIAGVVIGIAAQPILGNIIAGVQVAVTQPVRIGDSVIMDGNFSTVEDLRYTYAVLKTWDERRLIVPMRQLITERVENWSHTEVHQTCPVFLYIDYGADIEAIRQQFVSVTKDNELWDNETEPEIFVVKVTENTIQLRGAVSAVGPIEAWTLACEVREQMLGYLHQQQNKYLPTERFTLTESL